MNAPETSFTDLPCTATRDLLDAVQTCELEHHNDSLAHRMTNPDGSVTTWRS